MKDGVLTRVFTNEDADPEFPEEFSDENEGEWVFNEFTDEGEALKQEYNEINLRTMREQEEAEDYKTLIAFARMIDYDLSAVLGYKVTIVQKGWFGFESDEENGRWFKVQ